MHQSFQTEFLLPAHLHTVVADTEHLFDKYSLLLFSKELQTASFINIYPTEIGKLYKSALIYCSVDTLLMKVMEKILIIQIKSVCSCYIVNSTKVEEIFFQYLEITT